MIVVMWLFFEELQKSLNMKFIVAYNSRCTFLFFFKKNPILLLIKKIKKNETVRISYNSKCILSLFLNIQFLSFFFFLKKKTKTVRNYSIILKRNAFKNTQNLITKQKIKNKNSRTLEKKRNTQRSIFPQLLCDVRI